MCKRVLRRSNRPPEPQSWVGPNPPVHGEISLPEAAPGREAKIELAGNPYERRSDRPPPGSSRPISGFPPPALPAARPISGYPPPAGRAGGAVASPPTPSRPISEPPPPAASRAISGYPAAGSVRPVSARPPPSPPVLRQPTVVERALDRLASPFDWLLARTARGDGSFRGGVLGSSEGRAALFEAIFASLILGYLVAAPFSGLVLGWRVGGWTSDERAAYGLVAIAALAFFGIATLARRRIARDWDSGREADLLSAIVLTSMPIVLYGAIAVLVAALAMGELQVTDPIGLAIGPRAARVAVGIASVYGATALAATARRFVIGR
jgi:hypothetical protein